MRTLALVVLLALVAACSQSAPAPNLGNPQAKLARSVQDVYFPNWSRSLRWRAVGQRSDRLAGRPAVTVYYRQRGERLAYTIVGGPSLSQPVARVSYRNGVELRTLKLSGRLVVTWRRAGHTCVLSGTRIRASELQELAAWKAPGVTD